MVDQILRDPQRHLPKDLAKGIGTSIQAKWNRLPEERRNLLKLISRFEISREQATTIYVQEELIHLSQLPTGFLMLLSGKS